MFARRRIILAGALLVAVVVTGLGFVPNFLEGPAIVTEATGTILAFAKVRFVTLALDNSCGLTDTVQTIPISQDSFNQLADMLMPRNKTLSNLLQQIPSLCSGYRYDVQMASQSAPGSAARYGYQFAMYETLLQIHGIIPESPMPVEIQLTGFAVSITLSLNNKLPLKITGVKTNQNIQTTFVEKSCGASCSFSGTLTLALDPLYSSWAPIRVTLTIGTEVPIVWWSFRVSSSQRTLTVNLDLNPATSTVQLA